MQENTRFSRRLGAVGFRFRPSDEELLAFYLYTKIARMELPPQYDTLTLIKDCDLYGELEPWQIWEYYKGEDNKNKDDHDGEEEEEEMFFFTKLKKKSANGLRISRMVGCGGGAWQSEDTAKKIPPPSSSSSSTENALGFKKRFRYENKSNPEHDGDWIMIEYSLDPSLVESPHDQPNDYVLCRIKKNNVNVGKKKRKRDQEDQDYQVQVNNIAEEDRQVYEEIDHGDSQSQLLGLMTTNFWNHNYNPQISSFEEKKKSIIYIYS
ncbi:hypothetical protein LWI29_036063 [Acer saccharum]|uniref:NAC domain-containing protein n=1 Tax=Acer saccharum TaxID=4024 RepID=A0AA39VTS6_ACESA|nr:hypothetical protein LWI29_036063 [Acer saccharum]